ncbi:MAG TPA: ComEA family DNA-binding protein [Actinomycetes bacterium]|jgi:competence protein ComEA|nr:ComEA family DNA-binding protein [Actinomycetes bacterium]
MQSPPPFVLPPESRADRLRGLLAGAGRQRAAVALLVLLALAGAAALRLRAEPAPLHAATAADGPPVRSLPAAAPQAATAKQVAVDVVGRVRHPGLVHLPAGSRVADAIRAAGGVTARARLDAVNLARKVVDGEQIRIPAPGEALAPPAAAGPAPGAPTSGPLDLNTATAEQLDTLPGVGEVTAARIIDYRNQHPFTSVAQLQDVPGIGERRFEQLKDLVTVG